MSKDYTTYSFEDLINDDEFIKWVNHPTDISNAFWNNFIEANPSKASTIQQAQEAVSLLALASKTEIPSTEVHDIWTNIEYRLSPLAIFRVYRKKWIAAASVLFIIGIGYWFLAPHPWSIRNDSLTFIDVKTPFPKWIHNTGKTDMLVLLPDSSTALLKPQSQLKFNNFFTGKQRHVYLLGEAFFTIKKDAQRPFFVFTNDIVTRVIGTSFWVKAYSYNKEVTVDVKSGKVFVFRTNKNTKTEGLLLTPNQKAIFEKDEAKLTKTIVDNPLVLPTAKEHNNVVFKNAPISHIFQALEKRYGIVIIYDEEITSNCRLTTTLTNEEFIPMLDIICEGVEATYKVVDGQVIITSNGCP